MSEALKGALIIGQSGGPSSVINASAYGCIRTALDAGCITRVYGAYHGIKGVLNDELLCMDEEDRAELDRLPYTPSSALGSCRYKIKDPDEDDTDYKRILEIFKKYDVRYFCYNGGNDSMDTCNKISKYMKKVGYECRVMGIPKTIDNDLFGTDHCPGYASAAKYIATSVMEVSRDAHVYDTGMITIIECMGRHAGWLTAAAALANEEEPCCDFIYLPEVDFDMDKFVADVSKRYEEKKNCIVAVSEGVHYADGSFVSEAEDRRDRRLRPCPAGRPGCDARQHHERAHRRQGPRHRAQPAAALRRALRLRHRYRGSLHVRQDRCRADDRRCDRQDGRLRVRPHERLHLQGQAV